MKQWTNLDNNIRIDILTPSILQAQDLYIQDTLGTPFYKRLKEGVVGRPRGEDDAELIQKAEKQLRLIALGANAWHSSGNKNGS